MGLTHFPINIVPFSLIENNLMSFDETANRRKSLAPLSLPLSASIIVAQKYNYSQVPRVCVCLDNKPFGGNTKGVTQPNI